VRFASSFVFAAFLIASSICGSFATTTFAHPSEAEETIWNLEHTYWHYVEANDLPAYRNLWHSDFLGWPSMNPAPVHKDHITDWITSQTSTGHSFKLVAFKSAAIQSSGTTVVVCYWTTYKWIDKSGQGDEHTVRVTHTWVKNGKDWQIIGGMFMSIPTPPQN
jgi:ketosteroid isomerase-like protein